MHVLIFTQPKSFLLNRKNLKDFHIQPYLKSHAYPKMEPLKAKQLNQSYINLMKHQVS